MSKTYKCSWCNQQFESKWPAESPRYCSSKCRQAAYRDNKRKVPRGYQPDIKPIDKAIETKRADVCLCECYCCGQWFEVNGLQRGKQKFCSSKCRQNQYRAQMENRAKRGAEYQKHVDLPMTLKPPQIGR